MAALAADERLPPALRKACKVHRARQAGFWMRCDALAGWLRWPCAPVSLQKAGFRRRPRSERRADFAMGLIAAKSLKPCDRGVFWGLEFALKKRAACAWSAPDWRQGSQFARNNLFKGPLGLLGPFKRKQKTPLSHGLTGLVAIKTRANGLCGAGFQQGRPCRRWMRHSQGGRLRVPEKTREKRAKGAGKA